MKKLIVSIFLLLPVFSMAQNMSQNDMQDMMAQMQKVAACMQNIDQNEMKALESNSKKFEAEMKGLCQQGKSDKAQQKAIEFSKDMMNSPVVISMRKCTEKMPDFMKGMMPNMNTDEIVKDYSHKHICDEM